MRKGGSHGLPTYIITRITSNVKRGETSLSDENHRNIRRRKRFRKNEKFLKKAAIASDARSRLRRGKRPAAKDIHVSRSVSHRDHIRNIHIRHSLIGEVNDILLTLSVPPFPSRSMDIIS